MSEPYLVWNNLDDQRLAFIGVAKNSGKTTTLNYFLHQLRNAGRPPLGLLSVGIDGEADDLVIHTEKPTIFLYRGDYVVTAQKAAEKSQATLEYVESMQYDTPMGEVFLARVVEDGNVLLAGLRHSKDIIDATNRLRAIGVGHLLIDGAYNRIAAANPNISDCFIVSTGAILGDDLSTIINRTNAFIEKLTLESIEAEPDRALIMQALTQNRVLIGGPTIEARSLKEASALLALRNIDMYWDDSSTNIAIPGVITDGIAEYLLGLSGKTKKLFVADPTALHLTNRLWRKLRANWTIQALRTSKLLAISVNPTSIQGHRVCETDLIQSLRTRWPFVPIFNPQATRGR